MSTWLHNVALQMHYSALLGAAKWDQKELGWGESSAERNFDWDALTGTIKNHIGSLNFGYRKSLRENKVRIFE
jgi:hypothetical protein